MLKKFVLAACILIATPSSAESVKGSITAANGVQLTTYIDDFAGKAEYGSPDTEFKLDNGYLKSTAFVSRIKKNGVWQPVRLVVIAAYRGDWRFYDTAIFRGGESAEFVSVRRDVISCAGSRYGGCSHSESMYITVTPEQLAKYADSGMLPIQISGKAASGAVISVPIAHYQAMLALDKPVPIAPVAPTTPKTSEPSDGVVCVTCRKN